MNSLYLALEQLFPFFSMDYFFYNDFFSFVQTMFIVASTLLDLIKNLRAFAGLMVVSVISECTFLLR